MTRSKQEIWDAIRDLQDDDEAWEDRLEGMLRKQLVAAVNGIKRVKVLNVSFNDYDDAVFEVTVDFTASELETLYRRLRGAQQRYHG